MNRNVMVTLALAGLASGASADQVFRGFDQNPIGSGTLAAFPNSDAARAAYVASLAGLAQVQDFEAVAPGGVPASWTFSGGLTATFQNQATTSSAIAQGPSGVDSYPADGTRYLYTETRPGDGFFKLTFQTVVNSIGLYVSDASDWFGNTDVPGPVYIELLDSSDNVLAKYDLITALPPSAINSGGMGYFGVTADQAFAAVRIAQPLRASGSNASTDAIGIDQITVAVPAPGVAGVLGMGGLMVGRRRRV
jgi:hypothetical protein